MSEQIKISEIAREAGKKSKDVIAKAQELGINVSKYTDKVSPQDAERIFEAVRKSSPSKRTTAKKSSATTKSNGEKAEKRRVRKNYKANHKGYSRKENKENRDGKERGEEKRADKTAVVKPRGLKIIKKKRPPKIEVDPKKDVGYGKLSKEVQEEISSKKSSKKSIQQQSRKKRVEAELDIFNRDLGDGQSVYEEKNEIVLLDYRDQILLEDEEKKEIDVDVANQKGKKKKGGNQQKKATKSRPVELAKSSKKKKKKSKKVDDKVVESIEIPETIRVYEFAEKIKRPVADVIKSLFDLGIAVTKNHFLDGETIEILAEEFEIDVEIVDVTKEFDYVREYEEVEDSEEDLVERAPIITIMGHVDHGKTSLLDKIRSTKIAEREAGGITQHIGAYTVEHNSKKITFIDTPGHSAFSEMRKRGAKVTDIAIIVVAGDDGVKPQTKEAIKHAQDAGVPIIVAINKMDKADANPDMVKNQISELGLIPAEWGGETEFIPISAKTGMGIDELLETILVQAEILELRANPNRKAKAVVIESSLEKGRGAVATVIVQNGTLKIGDSVVVGKHYGRVRSLLDFNKKNIKSIAPGETGVIVGLNGVPRAGEIVVATNNEKRAKEFANKIEEYERQLALSKTTKTSIDELSSMIAEGKINTLKIILKTDVHGTLEAIKSSLEALKNDEVKVSIISEGVGGITENDVILAGDSDNVMIIGFNVRPTGSVKTLADQKGVKLKTYSVIYEIIDDVTNILTGMMKPIEEERNTGQAEIKQLFKVKDGLVAGCLVIDGVVEKGINARVIRDGIILGDTTVLSLKRFKDEVNEVKKGYECGILLKDADYIKEGDIIETYEKIIKKATLL